jgi:hypothetical protein
VRAIVLSIVASLFAGCARGPTFEEAPSRVSYSSLEGEKSAVEREELFQYLNAGNRLLARRSQSLHDGQMQEDQRDEYEYDADGRIALQKTFRLQKGVLMERDRTTFAYDDEGRLTVRTSLFPDGDTWQPSDRWEYAYSDDRLATMTRSGMQDDAWIPDIQWQYDYDKERRVTAVRMLTWIASPERGAPHWEPFTVASYTYNAAGLLTQFSEKWASSEEGTSRQTFTYKGSTLVSSVDERYENTAEPRGWRNYAKYEYARTGAEITISASTFVNGAWATDYRALVEMTSRSDSSFFDGAWFPEPLPEDWDARIFGVAPWNRYAE